MIADLGCSEVAKEGSWVNNLHMVLHGLEAMDDEETGLYTSSRSHHHLATSKLANISYLLYFLQPVFGVCEDKVDAQTMIFYSMPC